MHSRSLSRTVRVLPTTLQRKPWYAPLAMAIRFCLADSANAINATLYDKLNFNFIRDMAPVASIMTVPLVFEVNPSVPAKTVPEFVAYAKANSGKVNMASGRQRALPLTGRRIVQNR